MALADAAMTVDAAIHTHRTRIKKWRQSPESAATMLPFKPTFYFFGSNPVSL